jgi:hypothetical protein
MENLKARELRIGNYGINNQGDIFKVSWINSGIEGLLKPIPLTEDILKNNGKKLYGWDDMIFYRLGIIDIEVNLQGFFFDDIKIEFVHDLQNIYYYHNNKQELTIKL